MDRVVWHKDVVNVDQSLVSAPGVCLYDGEDKTAFENGTAMVMPRHVIWVDAGDYNCKLRLDLAMVASLDQRHRSFTKSSKVIIRLRPVPPNHQAHLHSPVGFSPHAEIMLSFRQGGEHEFFEKLQKALHDKAWEKQTTLPGRKTRTGIVGIERKYNESHSKTSENIKGAFEDLNKLMKTAKGMVELSKSISEKIRSKQGEVTEDETVKFKSHLLSLGIEDPVTKETHGSGFLYHQELAKELATALVQPVKDCGGMMALTDVYCRVNRARGFELISPDDLWNACHQLNVLKLPIRLHTFDSGVSVVILAGHSMAESVAQTEEFVAQNTSLSAEDYAQMAGISVLLAKERLVCAETEGRLCRDESVEGLRFYRNLFLLTPENGGGEAF